MPWKNAHDIKVNGKCTKRVWTVWSQFCKTKEYKYIGNNQYMYQCNKVLMAFFYRRMDDFLLLIIFYVFKNSLQKICITFYM